MPLRIVGAAILGLVVGHNLDWRWETTNPIEMDEMIELLVAVRGKDGSEREFRDWLVGTDRGALKVRHAADAVGAIAKYEAGEIGQEDFVGHTVRVKIIVEKKRGYPDQNRIDDYARKGGS